MNKDESGIKKINRKIKSKKIKKFGIKNQRYTKEKSAIK